MAESRAGEDGRVADRCVELIYEAAVQGRSWRDFLNEVRGLAPNGQAFFVCRDDTAQRAATTISAGIAPEWLTAFADHYARVSPWAAVHAKQPMGKVLYTDELLPLQALDRTEFYNDFLKPQGLATSVGGSIHCGGPYDPGVARRGRKSP